MYMDTKNKKVILLVEDDKALNRAAMFKLKQQGHRVIPVMRAEDALAMLKENHAIVDIVWLDILLPGMNGLEFLAEMQKYDDYKDIKVVICSVSGRGGVLRDVVGKFHNVVDYLIKSEYSISTLVGKVVNYA